jgi:hypothetical protein
MRFGVIKTLVENKLAKSFKDNTLKEDMRLFNTKLLKNKNFCTLMSIYDNLNENKSLDKETANYLVEDLMSQFNKVKLDESTNKFIKSWTKDVILENNYKSIDDLLYGDLINPEKKSIARKNIVESLGKTKTIVETKTPKIPISSMLKVANSTAKKYIDSLNESDREKVLEIIKMDDKKLNENFNNLKTETIGKIDSLINESDDELKKVLIETKNKIESVKESKEEYLKLLSLKNNL